ncbi:MAG: prepilin-type N-terminal cleavage/methylation domain-containing protein [Lachnospiraceae bacterium]|nr:prepilin-type N-terminal cleavage/methylation domain-containing protein [Lachnospiraceae bacterium]
MRGWMGKIRKAKQGITLVEVIVAMALSAIIMAAVASLLPSILRIYDSANQIAERNTLLNNVANRMVGDMADARQIIPGEDTLTIRTGSEQIVYTMIGNRIERQMGSEVAVDILPANYNRNMSVDFACKEIEATDGVLEKGYILTLTVTNSKNDGTLEREYAVLPLALE